MYATQQNLSERFGDETLVQLADRDGDGQADTGVLDQVLGDAAALIDGYVKVRYGLPLASTPPLLRALALDVAFYQLHPHGAPEEVRHRYKDALATLRDLAAGKVDLDVAGEAPASEPSTGEVVAPDRTFSRDDLGGF